MLLNVCKLKHRAITWLATDTQQEWQRLKRRTPESWLADLSLSWENTISLTPVLTSFKRLRGTNSWEYFLTSVKEKEATKINYQHATLTKEVPRMYPIRKFKRKDYKFLPPCLTTTNFQSGEHLETYLLESLPPFQKLFPAPFCPRTNTTPMSGNFLRMLINFLQEQCII